MAANTRDIRRRIKSVKNTAQITKAMQMVAAAKMRRAQQAALAGRPYAQLLQKIIRSIRSRMKEVNHPLLDARPVQKELVLLFTTDKGLCGALNTNTLREVSKFDPAKTVFVAVGRKGAQFLARTKRNLLADFELKDTPTFAETKAISKFVIGKFLEGEVDKVTIVYPRFVNTLSQAPTVFPLLPLGDVEAAFGDSKEEIEDGSEFKFEPSIEQVLDAILPYSVHYAVYQRILSTRASEHSARMVAMKSATDNAKQLVKDLTLEYNKIRQASITTELLEITTAQMALG